MLAGCLLLRPLLLDLQVVAFLLCLYVVAPQSLCCLRANLLFLKEHQSYWISAYLCDLILPNYLFKHPMSKYRHIQGPKGLGCQQVNVKGVHNSAYNSPQAPQLTTCLISLRWFLP